MLLLVTSGIAAPAGEELPLWELGAGIAGLSTPHYLGSAQDHNLLVPLPYPVYRGEWFRSDGSGVRTLLVDEERIELNVSLNGSLPVKSRDNDARRDMPDLGWLLEIGPTLRYIPWQSRAGDARLRLELPVRGAVSADGTDLDYRGVTVSPGVAYLSTLYNWNWKASWAATFADRRFHGYFYDVEPAVVTARRDEYRAKAGYTASRFSLSATRRFGNWLAGGFVGYHSLHGATNNGSPLVKERGNFSAGLMLVWFFKQSMATVTELPEAEF